MIDVEVENWGWWRQKIRRRNNLCAESINELCTYSFVQFFEVWRFEKFASDLCVSFCGIPLLCWSDLHSFIVLFCISDNILLYSPFQYSCRLFGVCEGLPILHIVNFEFSLRMDCFGFCFIICKFFNCCRCLGVCEGFSRINREQWEFFILLGIKKIRNSNHESYYD